MWRAILRAPVFTSDDDGVAGDLQAGAVGKRDFSVEVIAHRTGGELPRGGGDGLAGDQWCDLGRCGNELRFAHGFGVLGLLLDATPSNDGRRKVVSRRAVIALRAVARLRSGSCDAEPRRQVLGNRADKPSASPIAGRQGVTLGRLI